MGSIHGLIYKDKTEILRRCFFDVQNEVGLGRQEEDYHSAKDRKPDWKRTGATGPAEFPAVRGTSGFPSAMPCAIYHEHETGYGAEVTQKLILFALQTCQLNVTIRPVATAYYHGIELRQSPLDCVVIEDCILLTFTALFDNSELNVRCKSYL